MKMFETLKVPEGDILEAMAASIKTAFMCGNFLKCDKVCHRCIINYPLKLSAYIQTHLVPLTEIRVPFGDLCESLKQALRDVVVQNGLYLNIQLRVGSTWKNIQAIRITTFHDSDVYRLDPDFIPETPEDKEVKEALATLEKHGRIKDGKVIV